MTLDLCECGRSRGSLVHAAGAPNGHEFVQYVDPNVPRSIYVIGSMRNPRVPEVAKALRAIGWDAFDDWYSPGEQCDDKWQEYERSRGRSFKEALAGYHAQHAFAMDEKHIERCNAGLLVLPAGKSAHIELGVFRGMKKPRYILMDGEPERFDLMYNFATDIFLSIAEMTEKLK